jgi:hypothetical protein
MNTNLSRRRNQLPLITLWLISLLIVYNFGNLLVISTAGLNHGCNHPSLNPKYSIKDYTPNPPFPRMVALRNLRIWFTNTTKGELSATKWFPSNVTEFENYTTNILLQQQLISDFLQLQQEEKFYAFIFNQSTSLIWSFSSSWCSNSKTYGPVFLYDIDGQPYLNLTHELQSLQYSNNCLLKLYHNETTFVNYHLAMQQDNLSLASTFIPGTDIDTYHEQSLSGTNNVYPLNVTIKRLASSLEQLWYVERVDIFYNFDLSWQMLGVTDRTPLEQFLQEWGIPIVLIIIVITSTLLFVRKRKH